MKSSTNPRLVVEVGRAREFDSCDHGQTVETVPDTRPGMPAGSTRSQTVPCPTHGGAR